MIVVALHFGFRFLEADVVEARKRRAIDVLDGVIGHEEVLLPAHEHVVAALQAVVVEVVGVEGLLEVGAERGEFALRREWALKRCQRKSVPPFLHSPNACDRRPRRRPICASGTDTCAR